MGQPVVQKQQHLDLLRAGHQRLERGLQRRHNPRAGGTLQPGDGSPGHRRCVIEISSTDLEVLEHNVALKGGDPVGKRQLFQGQVDGHQALLQRLQHRVDAPRPVHHHAPGRARHPVAHLDAGQVGRVGCPLLLPVAVASLVLVGYYFTSGVGVGETVGVWDGGGRGPDVGVAVGGRGGGVAVGVSVETSVGVAVGVEVAVGASVGTSVEVAVGVEVATGASVGVAVSVAVGTSFVAVGVAVGPGVGVAVGIGVGRGVLVGNGVEDGVGVGLATTTCTRASTTVP